MEKYYNERNEFDEELYENERRKSAKRIKALLFAMLLGGTSYEAYNRITREEFNINGTKLVSGQYDTLYNPSKNDLVILTGKDENGRSVDSNYYYDAITNRIVPRNDYEEGYYPISLSKIVKDGAVEQIETGINKYNVYTQHLKEAAQVEFAIEYISTGEYVPERETAEEVTPDYDLIMVNDLNEDYKTYELSPTDDLALFNEKTRELAYIHLEREGSYDLFTGNPVNIDDYVGSSPVNVYDYIRNGDIAYRIYEAEEKGEKDLIVITASDFASAVYYDKGGKELSIGAK